MIDNQLQGEGSTECLKNCLQDLYKKEKYQKINTITDKKIVILYIIVEGNIGIEEINKT